MNRLTARIPRRLLTALLATTIVLGTAGPGLANPIQTEGVIRAGVYSDKAAGANPNSTTDINALNTTAGGKKVTFGGTFHDVCETGGWTGSAWNCNATTTHPAGGQWSVTRELLDEIWKAEATPFANLMIPGSSASIAQGHWNTQISNWADHVKGYLDLGDGRTVIIAPLQEANWTNNGDPLYGCPANRADYRLAFQRIVNTFRDAGMDETKVRFAFAPNAGTKPGCGTLAEYYPGHEYVDVLGFSNYNFGVRIGTIGAQTGWNGCVGSAWDAPQTLFDGIINQLKSLAPFKPILIAQTGAPQNNCGAPSGQNQSTWLNSLFSYAAAAPGVAGFIYFNINTNTNNQGNQGNYLMWTHPSTLAQGWKDGMLSAKTLHEWPLTDWFKPGALHTDAAPADPCPDGKDCNTFAFVRNSGEWVRHATLGWAGGTSTFYYGNPGDYPIMGDWNCNGTKTPGQYRQSDGYVYLRNANTQGNADIRFFFGNPGDIPIVGDFNNNGCDTVSIYRPSNQTFYIINALGKNDGGLGSAQFSYVFGNPGDKPFVGDFNGNGTDTVGLHRETTGLVYYRNSHTQGNADNQFIFGDPGDKIFAGDWNGNGKDTVGIYRPSNGTAYLRFTNSQGNANYTLWVGNFVAAVTG